MEKQLRKPTLDQEPFFYFDSSKLKSNIQYVKDNQLANLILIPNQNGFSLDNVDFLRELTFVEKIQMGACTEIENFEGLNYLENLKQLTFNAPKKIGVNLSKLTSLEELYFTYNNKISGLAELVNLKKISVGSGNLFFFDKFIFSKYRHLKELQISMSLIENLNFLENNRTLEFLEFNLMKGEFSLDGIQYLAKMLKRLKLISSKKISNIEFVTLLENLEMLVISNSVILKDTFILKKLKKLKAFSLYGSSYFISASKEELQQYEKQIDKFNVQIKTHYK